jgi:cytoskeletal protein CcmA (bactofilin family)
MSFPGSPANNQVTTINGSSYIYDYAENTWTRINVGLANLLAANANVYSTLTSNLSIISNLFVQSGLYWAGNGASIPSTGSGSGGNNYTTSATPPTSPTPVPGDQWYDTVYDILYEYVNDGTTSYWVDVQSPTTFTDTLLPVVSGNITFNGNLDTVNLLVTQTANISGNLVMSGNIVNPRITGNISASGNLSISNVSASIGTFLGNVTSANVTTGNLFSTSSIIASGNVTSANINTGNIITGTLFMSGNLTMSSTVLSGGTIAHMFNQANVVASAPAATTNIDVLSSPVTYYTANATTNFTANVRGNATTPLNNAMSVGKTLTVTILVPQSSAFYINSFVIDSVSVTPVWQGTTVSSGSANSIDIYTYTIIKTATSTFKVFASRLTYQHTG